MAEERSGFRNTPDHGGDAEKLKEQPREADYWFRRGGPKRYEKSDKGNPDS
jgi:hypothetical protein